MYEFEKQKFLEAIKNIFVKKKRTTRDQQLIRQFFQTCKSWPFWQKITKNSETLLDLLIENFVLVQHDIDTPIQIKGNSQEKFVILLIQGFIEVRYERENSNVATKEQLNSLLTESKFTDLENSVAESKQSQKSLQSLKFNQKRKPTSNQQNKQKSKNELIQQNKELLKDIRGKAEFFQQFSSSDLDYVEIQFANPNQKKINQKHFQSSKLSMKIIYDECNQQIFRSKTVEYNSKNQKESHNISLSTKFETGDVMNQYLFFERNIDYDNLTYAAQSDISFVTLSVESIENFMTQRTEYLKKYDCFLDQFLVSEILPSPLIPEEINYLKQVYILNESVKQGDKVTEPFNCRQVWQKEQIQNQQDLQNKNENILIDNCQQDKNQILINDKQEQMFNFYLIKEGFFDLQVVQQKDKYFSIQKQYSFVGNELNQKQIITVQNKKQNEQYNTIDMLQKGQIFGEEIIFDQNNKHSYCVVKKTPYSELIQFQFQKPEKIPPSLFQYIFQQYNQKKQIQLKNDHEEVEEDNESQYSITAKYNSQNHVLYEQDTFKITKDTNFEQNINQYQIDMTPNSLRQTAEGFFQISSKKDNQKQVKKIVLNEQLNQQLNHQFNKSYLKERNKNQELQGQLQTNSGGNKINNRCQSGQNNGNQDITNEDVDFNINLPKPIIPVICRKNKFVKKNKFIERPNSPTSFHPISPNLQRPKTTNSQSPPLYQKTTQPYSVKNPYLPPIHTLAQYDELQFYEQNKYIINNQQNINNNQTNQTNIKKQQTNFLNTLTSQTENQINETTINQEVNQTSSTNNQTNIQNNQTNQNINETNYQIDETNFEMNATNCQINQQSQSRLDQLNTINQTVIQRQNTSDKFVKTIKIQFDSSEEGSNDSHTFQYMHSNSSPIKQRGQLFRGRSLNKFNKIVQNNPAHGNYVENREQDENKEIDENNLQSQDNFHKQYLFAILGTQQEIQKRSPLTQRVITDGLKGSKIKKTPKKDKEKKEEGQKKSELIKLLYQIEHEKQVQQQQLKSSILNQMQQISSHNITQQKFIRQKSQDHFIHNTYDKGPSSNRNKINLTETSPKQKQIRNSGSSPLNNRSVKKISINSLSRPQLAEVKGSSSDKIGNIRKISNDQKAKTDQNFFSNNKKQSRTNINESKKSQEKKNKSFDKSKDKNRENKNINSNKRSSINNQDKVESDQKRSSRTKSLERGPNQEKTHSKKRKNKESIKEGENRKQNNSKKIIDEEEIQNNKQKQSNTRISGDEDIDKNPQKKNQKQNQNEISQKDTNKVQQNNLIMKSKQHKIDDDKDQKEDKNQKKQKDNKQNLEKEDKKKQKQNEKNQESSNEKQENQNKQKKNIKQSKENDENMNDKKLQINQNDLQKHKDQMNQRNGENNENDEQKKEPKKIQVITSKKQRKTQNQLEESDEDKYPSPKQRNTSKGQKDKNEKISEMRKAYQGDQKQKKQEQTQAQQEKNNKNVAQDKMMKDDSQKKIKKKEEQSENQETKHKKKVDENQEQLTKLKHKPEKQTSQKVIEEINNDQPKSKEQRKQSKIKEDIKQRQEQEDNQNKNRPMSPKQKHQKIKDANEKSEENQNKDEQQNIKANTKEKRIVKSDNNEEPQQNKKSGQKHKVQKDNEQEQAIAKDKNKHCESQVKKVIKSNNKIQDD